VPESQRTIKISELPEGAMKTVQIADEKVLLVNVGGKIYGMGAVCKHEEWDLSEGILEGTKITCAGHGAVWDIVTGSAEFDEELESEPLYDVQVKDDYLYVSRRRT
jgi:3-phenylpropionate/trans-cinnamate dioxygenase ferredoxin component